ncbi:hypothetical protein, partial [Mameliella alba]
ICASLNQKRSDMITARFRTVKHASQTKSMGPDPREVRLQTRHLRIAQPEKIRHVHRSFSNGESCSPNQINAS